MHDHLDDIENEFKVIHENQQKETPDPFVQKIYRNNLFLYLGYMLLPFILSLFLILSFRDNEFFFKDVSASENAIEKAVSDVNALLIIDESYLDNFDPLYKDFFRPVGTDGLSTIYVHSSATFITDKSYFTSELIDNQYIYIINDDILDNIINGTVTTWSNHADISFYIPYDDVSPRVAGSVLDDIKILIPAGFIVTLALNAIFSFVVMLIVAIPMIIISRPVIQNDLNLLKSDSETVGSVLAKSGIGILYMFAANIVINIIVISLSSLFSIPDQISANQLSLNLMLKSPYFILIVISAVFLGPVVEELVFRKSFFGLIKNKNWALVISSFVFGLIHISTEILTGNIGLVLISSLPYIGGGFVFGYIYLVNKKNITIPILAHMGYNLISVLMSMFLLFSF